MPDLALLFDFDGTVYTSDLPVLSYARHCAEHLSDDAATDLIDGIRFFLEGKATRDRVINLAAACDPDEAVETLAGALGLTTTQIRSAYCSARADLARSAFALDATDGLVELLDELGDAHVMVVTDAPATGVAEVLTAIGLSPRVDEVITEADKPAAMPGLVAATLRRIDAVGAPQRLMVVGDQWRKDLADAHLAGARTAMVDRFARRDGCPDLRADDLPGLIPGIAQWAREQRQGREQRGEGSR